MYPYAARFGWSVAGFVAVGAGFGWLLSFAGAPGAGGGTSPSLSSGVIVPLTMDFSPPLTGALFS
jgi:hypothetical protein